MLSRYTWTILLETDGAFAWCQPIVNLWSASPNKSLRLHNSTITCVLWRNCHCREYPSKTECVLGRETFYFVIYSMTFACECCSLWSSQGVYSGNQLLEWNHLQRQRVGMKRLHNLSLLLRSPLSKGATAARTTWSYYCYLILYTDRFTVIFTTIPLGKLGGNKLSRLEKELSISTLPNSFSKWGQVHAYYNEAARLFLT